MKTIIHILKSSQKILALSLLGLVLLTSCEDVVDIKLEEGEPLLVVDAWITNQEGTACTVKLSTTSPYLSQQTNPKIKGAMVEISDNEGNSEVLIETADGIYKTQILQGKIGNTYTLRILNDGEEYIAETQIKPVPPIDSLRYDFQDGDNLREEGIYVYYYGPELPTEEDAYRLKIFRNGEDLLKPNNIIVSNDKFVNGNYIGNVELNFNEPVEVGDMVTVEIQSITQDAYYFFTEVIAQTNNGGLFSNPPANVRTNIRNINPNSVKKAVGYFGGSAISRITGKIEAEDGIIK